MVRRSKAKYEVTPIEAVVHRGDSRVNIPTAELRDFALHFDRNVRDRL